MVGAGIAGWAAATVVCFGALAELLHARRCRRLARLAHGPVAKPRPWVRAVSPLRVAALALLGWGLVALLSASSGTPGIKADPSQRHLVLAIDVSPSMYLSDAGAAGNQTRADRARDLLRAVLERIDTRRLKVSVVALYSGARPVVEATSDPEVVRNILDDLPMEFAFDVGKTTLFEVFEVAAELTRKWPRDSGTMVLVTDGDTVPKKKEPALPAAISRVLIVGVGNTHRGLHIDGHSSKQERDVLRGLATRMGGVYWDGNVKHIPSPLLAKLWASGEPTRSAAAGQREWALAAIAAGGVILALLSPALALAGSSWPPRGREGKEISA